MILIDSRIEFLALAEPGAFWIAYVERERLDVVELAKRDIVLAVAPCKFLIGRRFEWALDGEQAAIIEMHGADAVTVEDFCAWPLNAPDKCATLLGRCSVLGAAALVNPASWFEGQCLRAWRTPLQWLQAKAEGCVLVDPRHAAESFARVRGEILVEDATHAFAIWRASRLPKRMFVYDNGQ
jgi:hypothetical protein